MLKILAFLLVFMPPLFVYQGNAWVAFAVVILLALMQALLILVQKPYKFEQKAALIHALFLGVVYAVFCPLILNAVVGFKDPANNWFMVWGQIYLTLVLFVLLDKFEQPIIKGFMKP